MRSFFRHIRHTLSGKLMLLFIAFAALIMVSVASVIAWSFRTHFEQSIRPHIMQYLEYVEADIGTPPDQQKARALAKRLSIEIHYQDDSQQWSTSNISLIPKDVQYYRKFSQTGVEYGFGENNDREYLVSRYDNYTLAFSIPLNSRGVIHKFIPVVIVLIILTLLYLATRRLISPIATLKKGVGRIGQGELGYRLEIKRKDELGELAGSIDDMAEDIEQMLEAKRQLLLAISHELRSPLTRARVALALLDDTGQRADIEQDLDEMEKLITELLEAERLNTRHSILNKTPTVLQDVVRSVTAENFSQNAIAVDMPDRQLTLDLDQSRMKLLLKNILDNAIQHNPDDAKAPEFRIEADESTVRITIQDHGQGIAAEHLPHLTEPFYRTDKARQRQTGGYGLGLYLCKVIASAHGGDLQIDSDASNGTKVTITLPCNRADKQ